jgi:hypothetical protein
MGRLVVFAISLVLLGCSQKPTAPDSMPPSELSAAPSTVTIGGKTLTLTASLWRDFMPISPPDGKPLAAVLRVNTADGSPVPTDVRAGMVFIVYGTEVWSKTPAEERARSETAPAYEFMAREGPKWGPGVEVDVVVRLTSGGGTYLLSARKQRIDGAF